MNNEKFIKSVRRPYISAFQISNTNLEKLFSLKELFIVNRVEMVITGHDHQKDYREFGNTKYIARRPGRQLQVFRVYETLRRRRHYKF